MKKENHFGEKIIEKIKESHIAPKPRWQFLLKDYLVWGLGGLALLIGGFVFSVIIYMFTYNDWSIYNQVSDSLLGFMLLTLPYFWIVILILFVFVVNYNLRHTKKGYRFPISSILVATIVISVLLGIIFFGVGMGQAIDDVLGKKVPLYADIINHRVHLWDKAQSGRIAGIVNSIKSEDSFTLITPDKKVWLINAGQANLPSSFEIIIGRPLKLIGERISTSTFIASEILRPGPGKGFFERPMHDFPDMFKMMEEMHGSGMQPIFRPRGMMQGRMELFEEFPELKMQFEEDILENLEMHKQLLERDPRFIERLEDMDIRVDVINALKGE